MKRGTLVAVAILVVLLGVYLFTRDTSPQFERSPMTIQKVEGLNRIEIRPPSGDGSSGSEADAGGSSAESDESEERPEKIVFEKRDGEWWLMAPVEAPVSDSTANQFEEVFGAQVGTDDLPIEATSANKNKYDLQPSSRARLRLYGGGGKEPAVDLFVGKEISIRQTDAQRTFVQKPDDGRIYRANFAIGEFLRQSVSDFRSKEVTELSKDNVTRVEWRYEDGLTLVLEKKNDSWKLLRPQVDWELDDSAVDRAIGSLATMTADGFADDRELSELGLKPPTVRIEAVAVSGGNKEGNKGAPDASGSTGSNKEKSRKTEIHVGRVEPEEGSSAYYAKVSGKPYKYKLTTFDGENVLARLGDIRSKTPREFDKKAFTRVEFPGEAGVVIEKKENSWELVRPEMEKSVNKSKLDSKLSSIASLTVKEFPDISPADAGLTAAADRLRFETKEGEHAILFGDEVDEESGDRYVKFVDDDEVYVVSKFIADKLHPKGEDFVGKPKRPSMGKGLPKGGGMGGMRKKQILRKLKQKMGR